MKRIYLDMDGVLADFIGGTLWRHNKEAKDADNITEWNYYKSWGLTTKEFWDKCRGYDFWYGLDVFPWAKELVAAAKKADPDYMVCTQPSLDNQCIQAKLDWLDVHLDIPMKKVALMQNKWLLAKEGRLLIDDNPTYCANWEREGGEAWVFNGMCHYNDGDFPHVITDRIKSLPQYRR